MRGHKLGFHRLGVTLLNCIFGNVVYLRQSTFLLDLALGAGKTEVRLRAVRDRESQSIYRSDTYVTYDFHFGPLSPTSRR